MIQGPDRFSVNWIRRHYDGVIRAAASGVRDIEYRVDPALFQDEAMPVPAIEPSESEIPDEAEQGRLDAFAGFVSGPSNALALEAARAVARGRANRCSPLYLAGPSGVGKTYLCKAIRETLGRDVVYRSAEEFTSEVTGAMRTGKMASIRDRYRRSANVLILEDVQFLAGKRATQMELFHTLEHLMSRDRTVVLSADRPPFEIDGLDPKLASRMGSGFVACIAPPPFETRLQTLRLKAAGGGVRVPEDCLELLAQRPVESVLDLLAGLNQVVARSTLLHRPINTDLVREALSAVEVPGRPRRVEELRTLVGRVYGLNETQLRSRSRRRSVSRPRQIAMYLCRRYTEASLADIGRAFDKDHTTVLYSINAVEQRMRESAQFRYEIEALLPRLNSPNPVHSASDSSRGTRRT